jgi:thioesterase domain-containing protein
MSDELGALRGKLATEIPVTQHLGLEVVGYDAGGLTLAAPLSKNVNHEGTAFAGSVNAVAALAGWGWVWLTLRRSGHEGHVVLQDSSIQYLRPIETDFTARCLPAETIEIERLLAGLTRHRKGRVALAVEIRTGGTLVATFQGRFVALAAASLD